MLQVKYIKENIEVVKNGLLKRNWAHDQLDILDRIIELDDNRKQTQTLLDNILSKINNHSKQIGLFFKSGEAEKATILKTEVANYKEESKQLEFQLENIKKNLEIALFKVPNVPNSSVPIGKSDEENQVFKDCEIELPILHENAMPHWEIAAKYDLIDFNCGAKITGTGFPVYKGNGARLQRALVQFFLDQAADSGYLEVNPPFIVNEASGLGTGNLPDKEGQMYYIEKDNFYLIPTAEVPVTNMHRGEFIKMEDLPLKYCAFSPCFRREAGSYGADVKGLNRLHQFEKVEIVQFQHPDKSYDTLTKMISHVEGILKKLELPYKILRLCGGDLTFASALTFDFEVFSAAQKRWLEVSSVSNFETFQSNRMKIRFKDENGKSNLVHTLNGSALALPRIMAAILENYQTETAIKVPEVLIPYTKFDSIT